MSDSPIQKFTVSLAGRVRGKCRSLGKWLRDSPRLKDWFYPPEKVVTPAEKYREVNVNYFSDLHTQERMLADKQRMAFYHEAIQRKIKSGDRVIDLGTGTGFLPLLLREQERGRFMQSIILQSSNTPECWRPRMGSRMSTSRMCIVRNCT
jgi:hypothetical protein